MLSSIKGNYVYIQLITNTDNIGGSLDAVPAQLGNVNHTVHTTDIHECAVRSQGLDNAVILSAFLNLVPNLLLSSLTGFSRNCTDRADHTAASTVNLGNLHLYLLTDHCGHIAALSHVRLRSRNEHADALYIGNQATLVFFRDDSIYHSLLFAPGSHIIPYLHTVQLLLGQLAGALLIVHTNNEHLDLIANLQDILGLNGGICADFIIRDVAGVLGAQIDLDFGGANTCYDTGNFISCI